MATKPTIYIGPQGTLIGNKKCDYYISTTDSRSNAQKTINRALKYIHDNARRGFTTVYLKGPFTYNISGMITIYSNTILTGDKTAVVKLIDNAGWHKPGFTATINHDTDPAYLGYPLIAAGPKWTSTVSRVEIAGFTIDGNHDNNFDPAHTDSTQVYPCQGKGLGHYNFIYFNIANNVKVHDMTLQNGHNDVINVNNGSNLSFYRNAVTKMGNNVINANKFNNVQIYSNTATLRKNSFAKLTDCSGSVYQNVVSGYANAADNAIYGIEIERLKWGKIDLEIKENYIHDVNGPGIRCVVLDNAATDTGSEVRINHNVIYKCGLDFNENIIDAAGITINGIKTVKAVNNTIDYCYGSGITCSKAIDNSASTLTGIVVTAKNNIITNTKARKVSPTGTGVAIHNKLIGHTINSTYNDLYNNEGNSYAANTDCTAIALKTGDLSVDPAYVDEAGHNYILKSKAGHYNYTTKLWDFDPVDSPCIDKGDPADVFTLEPDFHGNRIDMGFNGGTIYASKSSATRTPYANFSTTNNGLSVFFIDLSLGSPTSWLWEFGDGRTSTLKKPYHTFPSGGTFTVKLTVSNAAGTNSITKDVTVIPPIPKADFLTSANGSIITFVDTSTGNPSTWTWDFGDNSMSNAQSPVHAYAKGGTYTVTLIVSNVSGSNMTSKQIVISADLPAYANFNASMNGLTVHFYDSSANNPNHWTWEFGDNIISTAQNPVHTYSSPGTYRVKLTASNTFGSTYIIKTITLKSSGPAPIANFSQTINGLTVAFTDLSTGSPKNWSWNFGDHKSSIEQNPTHIYAAAGTYKVDFVAINDNGYGVFSKSITLIDPSVTLPQASFTNVITGSSVAFTDTSTNTPTAWIWDFGDGSETSNLQNPSHIYTHSGSYTVTLTVTNAAGSNTTTNQVTIEGVDPPDPPVAETYIVTHDQAQEGVAGYYYVAADSKTANVAINAAIKDAGAKATAEKPYAVLLKATAGQTTTTYWLSDHLHFDKEKWPSDNIRLVGETGVILKIAEGLPCGDTTGNSNREWGYHSATGVAKRAAIHIWGVTDVTISNLEIDGSYDDLYTGKFKDESGKVLADNDARGRSEFTLINIAKSSKNIKIDHVKMYHGAGDGVGCYSSETVEMCYCDVNMVGYDAMECTSAKNVKFHHNIVAIQEFCGIRPDSTSNCEIYDNEFYTGNGGASAVLLKNTANDILIHHNYFHDIKVNNQYGAIGYPGLGTQAAKGTGHKYYNNLFLNCLYAVNYCPTAVECFNNIALNCTNAFVLASGSNNHNNIIADGSYFVKHGTDKKGDTYWQYTGTDGKIAQTEIVGIRTQAGVLGGLPGV
jgi:PKD repeat protein